MRRSLPFLPLLVPLLVPALAVACGSSPPAGSAAPASAPEPSVRPGVNERFLDPALDVEGFVATFEGESREVARAADGIAAAAGLAPGMRVADVGAGTGLFLERFDRAVRPGGRVYALDIAPGFVEHMRAVAEERGLEEVEPRLCGERSVDLPPGSIDLAFVCDTYHHFEYPRSTLASLHEALVPGGRLVVVDFERIPGVSREWILGHVRAGKETVIAEIEAAGFALVDEPEVEGLEENYVLRFRRV